MSEMLGNQYFIARRYFDARSEFETEVSKNPTNYSVKKKLIICYLQTDQFERAFDYFYEIVMVDIRTIIYTDLDRDDCPCPEIIEQTLPKLNYTNDEDQFIKLGMLYLYCSIDESIKYFEKVSSKSTRFEKVREIIKIEKSQLTIIN